VGRDLDLRGLRAPEARDDARMEEALARPERQEGALVPPAVLTKDQPRRLEALSEGGKGTRDLRAGEGLGTDEQPVGWLVDQPRRLLGERELLGGDADLAEEPAAVNAVGGEGIAGRGIAGDQVDPLAGAGEGTGQSDSHGARTPDGDSQLGLLAARRGLRVAELRRREESRMIFWTVRGSVRVLQGAPGERPATAGAGHPGRRGAIVAAR
jgi:hypothetical protein